MAAAFHGMGVIWDVFQSVVMQKLAGMPAAAAALSSSSDSSARSIGP
jgi:hypothetical protein